MSSNPTESLQRAQSGQSNANYRAIIEGFAAKGIPADDIHPRENVLTYDAWQAKGRQVRRGEHGVRVVTFIHTKDKTTGQERKRPWSTRVFHVSQTDPKGTPAPTKYLPLNPGPGHTLTPMPPDPKQLAAVNGALAQRFVVRAVAVRSDAEIVAACKGKALMEYSTEECEAMLREMQRAQVPAAALTPEVIDNDAPWDAAVEPIPFAGESAPSSWDAAKLAQQRVDARRERTVRERVAAGEAVPLSDIMRENEQARRSAPRSARVKTPTVNW